MPIDWLKAEQKPESSQKVEGKFLLDLRAKVNDLERQLTETNNELTLAQFDMEQSKATIEKTMLESQAALGEKEMIINGLKQELEVSNDKLKEIENELLSLTESSGNLKSAMEGLKGKISDLEGQLNEANSLISSREEEANKLNSQITELNNTIEEKDKLIEELNNTIEEKDKLITEKEQLVEEKAVKLEKVEVKPRPPKPAEVSTPSVVSEERLTCPMCGAAGRDIKSVEDKTKFISYVGHVPMFAKKKVCKKCGYEF